MKKDPCKKYACDIQKCLYENRFQEDKCVKWIEYLRECCVKWGDSSISCSGIKVNDVGKCADSQKANS